MVTNTKDSRVASLAGFIASVISEQPEDPMVKVYSPSDVVIDGHVDLVALAEEIINFLSEADDGTS